MTQHAIDVTESNFLQEVIEASHRFPVLVDFWAPWCGPCRSLGPILERLAAEYQGRFRLAKVNSDENQALAAQFGVRGIPNVKAVVDGQIVNEFTGALPESAVREFIDALLPSPAEPLRQEALAARARGEGDATRKLLLQAIHLDPRHEPARLDLIDVLLDAGDFAEAQRLLDEVAENAKDRGRIDSLAARLALARGAAGGADEAALRARLAADAADLAARLALANLLALKQDYRAALEELLEIVRRDRAFEDDIGRKTMLQIFSLLGGDSDLVREYRGRLSTALNR
ncbi:MAG: co-chaperone YbbN [Rhodocyclaceae bacterium]|nr:co-chaperone YbbN [Rhodocyclaceae bacterium]HNQ56102.1 tetratricopeptide repeat protein [Candidatus Desulfobacillus denitrificans]HNT63714.1 tetratricopeptide repeat protein [Candidatus Desulfobacillus denitrificans]